MSRQAKTVCILAICLALVASLPAPALAEPPRAPAYSLLDELVSYWPLDEASGARVDSAGSNDLTADVNPGSTTGKIGSAPNYPDSHGNTSVRELWVTDNASLNVTGDGFTVGAWSYPRVASHGFTGVIASQMGDAGNIGWSLQQHESVGKYEFIVSSDGTSYTTVTYATTYTQNTWHYVVAWFDNAANTINLQVNDGAIASTAFSGDVFNSTARLELGGVGTSGSTTYADVGGPMDEVGLWTRPISSGERTALYNSGDGCAYPFTECPGSGTTSVWRIGNYITDDSMETWSLFDNTYFSPWDSDPPFSQGTESEWQDTTGPVCDSNFRTMAAMVNTPFSFGDPATHMPPYIPPDVRSSVSQTFLWYGGPMYISFAYLTTTDAELSVYLGSTFGEYLPLDTGLSNTSDEWEAWYGSTDDLILGRYTLTIEVSGGTGSPAEEAAIDAVSVSEGDYQHCEYETTVNNPPPAEGDHILKSQTWVGAEGNLIDNSEFEELGGEITNWFLPSRGASLVENSQPGPNAGYVALFTGAPAVMTKPWIQMIYELPVADSRGFIEGEAFGVAARQFSISFMAAEVAEDLSHTVVKLENIDTGQIISFSPGNVQAYDPVAGTTWGKVELQTMSLTPGRYRLRFANPYPWQPASDNVTIYIDKVCVGAVSFIIASECSFSEAERIQIASDVNFANEEAAKAQATAIAGATATVIYGAVQTQAAAQATAGQSNQYATQTALAASGNQTQIVAATRTQRAALTATPVHALTSTAFVQNFHATMTAQSAGTQTRVAQVAATLTELAELRGTSTANAATQAGFQSTVFAQQTAAAQMTEVAQGQATLVVAATDQVNLNATIQPLITSYAATQYQAQTELAAESNATTQAQTTQAAAIVATANAIATQQVGIQQTQLAQLTAAPGQQQTAQAIATQVAQQYATLLATLQFQGTQQVMQQPPDQPMPDTLDVGCDRPTNPLNLAWWIDYEVCRILWYFTPNEANLQQIRQLSTQSAAYEPWGTLFELNDMQEELRGEIEQYNWYETGQEGSQDNVTLIENSVATPMPGGPVLIPLATTVPILMGDVNFGDPGLNYVFSISCELRLEENIGPYLTPPICFLIDITRRTGLLPIARIAFDIGAIVILIKWAARSMADFAGDPISQDFRKA